MVLRQIIVSSRSIIKNARCFSATTKFVDVSVNHQNGIATVTMNRPPANGLTIDILKELIAVQHDLEKQHVAGMILTSFSDQIFSAGVDLTETLKANRERLMDFLKIVYEQWALLYTSSFPTVALITGHAPAGACVLAMACEYRVMVNNFTIGLSETRLGIPLPIWPSLNMEKIIGRRNTELAVTTGKMFTTEEAHKIGLVDEIALDRADGLVKTHAFFDSFIEVMPFARACTKRDLRAPDIALTKSVREKELQFMVDYLMQPEFQNKLEFYISMLKKKST